MIKKDYSRILFLNVAAYWLNVEIYGVLFSDDTYVINKNSLLKIRDFPDFHSYHFLSFLIYFHLIYINNNFSW